MNLSPILKMMEEKKASDLFITAGHPPTNKVHGKKLHLDKQTKTPEAAMDIITSKKTPAQSDEYEATHDSNYANSQPDLARILYSS